MMISPEIMALGPLHLRWYGVCCSLGLLAAYFVMLKRCAKYRIDSNACGDIAWVGMLAGLVGARIEYVRREWTSIFQDDFMEIFRVWNGGLSFQGGLVLAAVVLLIMCRIRHWKICDVADLIAPALAFGHAFGRLGCFLNGCCFGKPYDGWGAVLYPQMKWSVMPVQLYEAVFCLILAGVLLAIEHRKRLRGCLFPLYMILYSIARFFIEYGRGDYLMGKNQVFTPAQSLFLFVVLPLGAVLMVLAAVRGGKDSPDDSKNAPEHSRGGKGKKH